MELLEVERLRRLAEIERRGLHERDGFLSAAAWLASRFKVAWGVAREHVRIARALDEMPVAQRALEEGEVSMSAVRILATAHDVDPEAFRRAEGQLVEAARIHSAGDLHRVTAFWRQTVEQDRAMDGEEQLHAPPPPPRVDDVPRDGAGRLRSRPGRWRDAADRPRSGARRRGALTRRGGSPNAPATACRCARRDLPSVARPRRPADGRGRASTRDGDRRRGRAAHGIGRGGARPLGPGLAFHGAAARLRRLDPARRDGRAFRTSRRRQADTGRSAGDAASRDRSGPSLPVPGLRPAACLVRRAPRRALGRRWADRGAEPPPALPPPSPVDPPAALVLVGTARRPPRVPPTGRIAARGGSGASVGSYGVGSRIRGGRGSCSKSNASARSPRIATSSRTVVRESGRPSVSGSRRWPPRNRSSISFR